MTESGLHIKKLSFSYGSKKTLHDISIDVPKGSFSGILGANGSGKTTLLKCINGILSGDGEVTISGQKKSSCSEREFAKLVSLMNQNTNLDFSFTCKQVVEFGRYPYWKKGFWGAKGDDAIITKAMVDTGTLQLADTSITCISGGERQRVLFAKILAQDTDVILLDEPTANLDIYYQHQLFSFGKNLAAQGKTVLAAVHDLNLALHFCDNFFLLDKGKLISQGKAEDVFLPENLKQAYNIDTILYENPHLPRLEIAVINQD